MRSSQNLTLSAQRDAGASSAVSPDWVLASPRSFGSIKDGKVIVFAGTLSFWSFTLLLRPSLRNLPFVPRRPRSWAKCWERAVRESDP